MGKDKEEKTLTVDDKDRVIAELRAELEELKKAMFDREAKGAVIDQATAELELTEADMKLIEAGCNAYGIGEDNVLKARIEDGAAVIITNGGSRVKYRRGDEKNEKFVKLTQIQVTGVNPAPRRKAILGKKD